MDGALLEYFIKKRGFTKDNFINRIGVAKSPFIEKYREKYNLS